MTEGLKEAIGLGITFGVAGKVMKATTAIKYKPRKRRKKK